MVILNENDKKVNSDTELSESMINSDSSGGTSKNCTANVEVHKEQFYSNSSKAVSKDSIVDIVNNVERLAVNGVMNRVSYKERARNKVNRLIHRHTL